MQLPYEILTLVFTYLPQKDLDTVQLVCKSWKHIASDNVWKEQFYTLFGTNKICPVSTQFTLWRKELIMRKEILHKWKKCSKNTDITLNSNLLDNTHIYCNFGVDSPKAVCFNSHKGAGNIIELDKGKIKRRIYASRYSRETLPVSAVDGSRFGMVYGFLDGTVTTVAFSRDGAIVSEYNDWPHRHDSAVSAVWIAKSRNFNKPNSRAVGIATGSFNGTVTMNNSHGHQVVQPEHSCVLLLEGSMYGSYSVDDGDNVIAYYESGALYLFKYSEDGIISRKLTTLPIPSQQRENVAHLYLCNNYAIVQTPNHIFLVDIITGFLAELEIPSGAEISAFTIDKSYTPGTKQIAAGLFTNEICVWEIPPIITGNDFHDSSVKVEIVNSRGAKQTPSPEDLPIKLRKEIFQTEINIVDTKPVWCTTNPIGYEHRLVQSEKPQITNLSMNSAVLLIAGYNGMVMAVDVLTGRPLKRINSRISKNVLDLTRYSRDGFVPVTHVEIDADPSRLRCLISVRPAVQFLDLGTVGSYNKPNLDKKRMSKSKHRNVNLSNITSRYDLEEDIELQNDFASLDAERDEQNANLQEHFGVEGMEDEDQLIYAMMLSQQNENANASGEQSSDDEDLRRALELSALQESQQNEFQEIAGHDESTELEEDEDLRRAIEMSLLSS